jgi:hypothetical protein
MNIDWLPIAMFIFGSYFTIFGLKLLFKAGFVEKLREGMWKPGELSKKNFPENSGYNYDKYVRGIQYFLSGLLFLGLSIYILFLS